MKLSSRSRYGFRAILELAIEFGNGPLQVKIIAERQEIPNKYLEQLIAMLKTAGLVRSIRGPRGGYVLTRDPSEIILAEIFEILEGKSVTVECVEHPEFCTRCSACVTRNLWADIQGAVDGILRAKTLQDLVDEVGGCAKKSNFQI